jgi:uncharacterized membrane protein
MAPMGDNRPLTLACLSVIAMKKYLVAGLLVWMPLIITIWVLKLAVDTLDQTLLILPEWLRTENWLGMHVPGMGVLLSLAIVLITGMVAANFVGQRLVNLWQQMLHRIPIVNSIYSSVKQVSDTLFSSGGQAFTRALLVRWPHEGMWTIAFQTGLPGASLKAYLPADGDYINVYVPSTPNPTGGYFVVVARKDVIELGMSVDKALKYVISMGVVADAAISEAAKSSH